MNSQGLEKFISELSSLIRARYPLIYLHTPEEVRSLDMLEEMGRKRDSVLYVWSRTQGITKGGKPVADVVDPMAALKWYEESPEKSVLVLKDFHPYLKDPGIIRKLRDLGQALKRSPKNIVILSPVLQMPPELAKEMAILDMPLPNREEIRSLVLKAAEAVPQLPEAPALNIEELTDAGSGLTYEEIENVLAKSLVAVGKLDKKMILDEKRHIVRKAGLVEFIETEQTGGAQVGGLDQLKGWLATRRRGLSQEAQALKLPNPKGILLVGIPGCGKSLTALTVGREWELPLLRLDLGRVFSGIVGSSESNIRSALAVCEAVSPCILWIDEIEKGLSGVQSSGQSDGGTTSRVFGTILTWMQEKKSPVFVVATANDISGLPPELLRKGRFDEIFFIDLPTPSEREAIFKIHMKRFDWQIEGEDLPVLVQKTESFSGSEIEQVLVAARYLAFGRSEAFAQSHVLQAIAETVPLSRTMRDRIEALRAWAQHRARPASLTPNHNDGDRFEMRRNSLEVNT